MLKQLVWIHSVLFILSICVRFWDRNYGGCFPDSRYLTLIWSSAVNTPLCSSAQWSASTDGVRANSILTLLLRFVTFSWAWKNLSKKNQTFENEKENELKQFAGSASTSFTQMTCLALQINWWNEIYSSPCCSEVTTTSRSVFSKYILALLISLLSSQKTAFFSRGYLNLKKKKVVLITSFSVVVTESNTECDVWWDGIRKFRISWQTL